MKKCETFEDLRSLGIESISEHTHIARKQLEVLLDGTFVGLSRIQAMGFFSILEREYGVNLDEQREEYRLKVPTNTMTPNDSLLLHKTSKSQQKWILGAIVSIIVLVMLAFFIQRMMSVVPQEEVLQLNHPIAPLVSVVESNQSDTLETNTSVAEVNSSVPQQNKSIASSHTSGSFAFKPKSKVWVGVMDLSTRIKTQKVTKDMISIDTTKNSLYVFGHGRMEILTPDENKTLRNTSAVWFVYENGALTQIDEAQFFEKNGGAKW
jgi:hypothetical protein